MRFIEKQRTLEQRQFLSFALWNVVLALAGCVFASLYINPFFGLPFILALLGVFKLIGDNNRLMRNY